MFDEEDNYNGKQGSITRSYARKTSLGNYEMADFFASRTIILPRGTSILEAYQMSKDLFSQVVADVETDIAEYKEKIGANIDGDWDAFNRVIESCSEFKPFLMADFEKLNQFQRNVVNNVKRAYKRSPEWKQREGNTTVANEQNRKA